MADDDTWPKTLALSDLHASEIVNWMQGDEPQDGWPDERGHYVRRDHVEELERRLEKSEAEKASAVEALESIAGKVPYADDPWDIASDALAELKGESDGG